jgi:argininosuccinate lyase
MAQMALGNFATATEIANYLVLQHNVPFRGKPLQKNHLQVFLTDSTCKNSEAHHIVGSLVGELSRAGKNFGEVEYCVNHITKKHKINGMRFRSPMDGLRSAHFSLSSSRRHRARPRPQAGHAELQLSRRHWP